MKLPHLTASILVLTWNVVSLSAQINQEASLPASVSASNCTPLAQFGAAFVFRQEDDAFRAALWHFDAATKQVQRLSTSATRAGEALVGTAGLWWIEEELSGDGKIQYADAAQFQVRTLHRFQGFNNRFLGLTNNGVVVKTGQQIIHLRPEGSTQAIETWGESILHGPFSWKGHVFWFDPERRTLFVYNGQGNQALSLGTFNSLNAVQVLGQYILFQTDAGWYRSDGSPAGTTLFYRPSTQRFQWTDTTLGDSVLLFTAYDDDNVVLWRSNGSATGTFPVKTLNTGRLTGLPEYFTVNAGRVFFIHWGPNFERVIWQSDGTSGGTLPIDTLSRRTLRVIHSGVQTDSGAYCLFVESPENGLEPVLFNGQWQGYNLRMDAGSSLFDANSSIFQVTSVGAYTFLAANDGITGQELWRLGPGGQQQRMGDLAAGGAWSFPKVLGTWNNRLYWLAGARGSAASIYSCLPAANINSTLPLNDIDWLQSIESTHSLGGSIHTTYMGGLARTPGGLIYTTGAAENVARQGITLTHGKMPERDFNAQGDHFLAQLDAEGRPRWIQSLAGFNPLSSNGQVHVAAAPNEGVYWAGLAWGRGQIGGQNYNFERASPILAHLSSTGKQIWSLNLALGNRGSIDALRSDAQGNIYLGGRFYDFQANIAGFALSASSSPAYFMAKLRSTGSAEWVQTFSGTAEWPGLAPINDLVLDAAGNVYGLLGVGGQNYTASCALGTVPGGVIKLSPSGAVLRSQLWSSNDYWYPTALDISPKGDVYLTGLFRDQLRMGDFTLRYNNPKVECDYTGFLAKMDADLQVLEVRVLNEQSRKVAQAIRFDAGGNYWLAGYQDLPSFQGPLRYSHWPFSNGRQRVFVEVYNPRHERLAERSLGVLDNFVEGGTIKLQLLDQQRVLLQGEYTGMLDTLAASSARVQDQTGYLLQFRLPLQASARTPDQILAEPDLRLVPNPTPAVAYLSSTDPDLDFTRVELFDPLGRRLSAPVQRFDFGVFRLNLQDLPAGVYRVVVWLGEQRLVRSLVKVG
jgi:ELWxxDGT repeat protein